MTTQRDAFSSMAVFVTSVETGSFSAAASKLGLTPSGVSKLVARLEDRLGTRLLQRTTRRMQLTQVGDVYFERARRLLADLDGLEREIESRDDVPRGTLRVSAPTVYGHVRILPLVLSFQHAFPEVKVHLALEDRIVDLVQDAVDVAVRMVKSPPLSCIARKLEDDRRVLCASPEYLARRGTPQRPRDLADHDCIVFVTRSPVTAWRLKSSAADEGDEIVHVTGRLQVNNTHSVREAARAGLGIADLAHYLAKDDLAAGRLVPVLDGLMLSERSVYAVYTPAPFVPARVRAFMKHLVDGFAALADATRPKHAALSPSLTAPTSRSSARTRASRAPRGGSSR